MGANENSNNEQTKEKATIITSVISGVCVIIAAIIGIFSYDLNKSKETLAIENVALSEQNNDWEIAYNELKDQFDTLNNQNSSLVNEIDGLKNNMEQYTTLADENNSLKNEISKLQNELQIVKENIENQETIISNEDNQAEAETNPISENSSKKVSIFDLDTFKGNAYWNNSSYYDSENFIDTYGNEHLTAYVAFHKKIEKDSSSSITYFINLSNGCYYR